MVSDKDTRHARTKLPLPNLAVRDRRPRARVKGDSNRVGRLGRQGIAPVAAHAIGLFRRSSRNSRNLQLAVWEAGGKTGECKKG